MFSKEIRRDPFVAILLFHISFVILKKDFFFQFLKKDFIYVLLFEDDASLNQYNFKRKPK